MTFLEQIFARLEQASGEPVLQEARGGELHPVAGGELLAMIAQARSSLAARGLKKGDRIALLAPNSIRWIALDLAMMAEGLIVVPLDTRQVPKEISAVIRDSTPSLILSSDRAMAEKLQLGPAAPQIVFFDAIFGAQNPASRPPVHHADEDAVTIVYTSGTSGEPKGVVLQARNITFMLGCTNVRLDQLMGKRAEPERIFQYAPFCFAAARVLLLTSLSRNSILTLSTDLTKLSEELKLAEPHYFVNVPLFLERVRAKIEEAIRTRGGWTAGVFARAQRAYLARSDGKANLLDSLSLRLANAAMFPAIRKSIGPQLRALICGSAPLALETQLFYMMLGIPVLQVYGLTETTAICTMDQPGQLVPGSVGTAIPGVEMTVSGAGEILVRGPNVFPSYWQRPADTAKALEGGWFHTGDQGAVDANGNWRITGRLKNLIVLDSGHNVAPEPLEHDLAALLPEAQQVVLVGNRRSHLAALITTGASNGLHAERIERAIAALNECLPHYKKIRGFRILAEPFTAENGLLTTMGKLKRDAISARFASEIDGLYQRKSA